MGNSFELGNKETGIFSVEFGKEPSFHISSNNSEDTIVDFDIWINGFLNILGYSEDANNIQYAISEELDQIDIEGSFGNIVIKNNGGLQYVRV